MNCLDHPGTGYHGILAQVHRRAAGVAFLANHRDFIPFLPLHAGNHANHFIFGLQDRALLNVKFKVGTKFMVTAFAFATVADTLQFGAKFISVAVFN